MRRSAVRLMSLVMVVGLAACTATTGASAEKVSGFEDPSFALGATPAGWTPGENMGTGRPAAWVVETDAGAPADPKVLTVRTTNAEATFNWCVTDGPAGADVEVGALVKPLSGRDDQGGGVLLRFQDANNYYVARWNPLEENVRLYVVKDGVRRRFGDFETKASPGWRRLVVRAVGTRFEVLFDGATVIEARDGTITRGGKVGLWTKADATTSFDDFSAVPVRN